MSMFKMKAQGQSIPRSVAKRLAAGTAQQEILWRTILDGGANVLAEARAGSAKSTSCCEAMWRLLEQNPATNVKYAVFSKDAADEFRDSCPPQVDVATLHSFGYQAIRKALKSRVEKTKTYMILDDDRRSRNVARYLRKSISLLVSQAKSQGCVVPPDEDKHPSEFDAYSDRLRPLLHYYDIEAFGTPRVVCDWATRVLRRAAALTELVDFDDMIWLPVVHDLAFQGVDLIFVDECQDLNPAQLDLIPKIAGWHKGFGKGARVVAVGDRFQSIYAFRGADSESVPRLETLMQESAHGLETCPLTITFRCPKSHVRLARQYVRDIEAYEPNGEGVIQHGVSIENLTEHVGPDDLVLCHKNAPVIASALDMIASRRPAYIRGRGIGDQLLAVIRSCGEHRTIASLSRAVEQWKSRELFRLEGTDGAEDLIDSVVDRAAGIQAVISACASPSEVPGAISELFSDAARKSATVFSTIHRAKGAEADTVWVIESPMRKPKQGWEAQQQRNIRYVGVTRAKSRMVFVEGDDGGEGGYESHWSSGEEIKQRACPECGYPGADRHDCPGVQDD